MSYPDYVADRDGLERWRATALEGDGHDMAHVNKNSLLRFVQTIDNLETALASITRERDAMRAVRESEWRDKADEHTTAINAAHPTNTTDPGRWDRYSQALAMVGNRHGKYALVDLVNWLLTTRAALVNGEGGE